MHALPGSARLPDGALGKYLLRKAFAPLLRDELLNQPKHGFALPIWNWMLGPLREVCEEAIRNLKETDLLHPEGIDLVWNSFLAEPRTPIWSRALALCVLGAFLHKMSEWKCVSCT